MRNGGTERLQNLLKVLPASQGVQTGTQVCPKAQNLNHDTTLGKKDPPRPHPNCRSSKPPKDQKTHCAKTFSPTHGSSHLLPLPAMPSVGGRRRLPHPISGQRTVPPLPSYSWRECGFKCFQRHGTYFEL